MTDTSGDKPPSGAGPADDMQDMYGRLVEEALCTDKAHLPRFPSPPSLRESERPEAMRAFEDRVRALVDTYVLSPVSQKEIKETIKTKLDGTVLDIEAEATGFRENVRKWLGFKKEMLEQADDTSLHRWHMPTGLYYLTPPNAGKAITDANPYVNIVDLEEFDLAAEVYPPFEHPPVWDKANLIRWMEGGQREGLGKANQFLGQVAADKQRMKEEALGKRVPAVAEHKETDLPKLKEEIRAYARELGFPAMGVTKVDRRYVAPGLDEEIRYDTLIVLAHEMPLEEVKKVGDPDAPPFVAFTSYRDGGQAVHKVADFIRSKGHRCLTRVSSDAAVKYPPHAVNAGMGNYSTFGICITPEVGTRTKMTGILIDAELPLDEPRDHNIEEFCARCRCCQKICPAGAIPKHERRFHGVMKRQTYHHRCWEYMATTYECMLCVRICPFSVIGYQNCMRALPPWYWYNLHRDKVDVDFLRSPWTAEG